MMETYLSMHPVRFLLIALTAVTLMMVSVFASASPREIAISYHRAELESVAGQQRLYERMKGATRQLCGSTNIRETGSVEQSKANAECIEGTLTAAVERLDHPAIKALHYN
jgi:UrcA family protein